jgi:ABC-type dipeptide/oligopeptide/nickel transport system permease subunit
VVPAIILGIPLAVAAGYYAGKLADQHTTRLKIQPEMPAGPVPED